MGSDTSSRSHRSRKRTMAQRSPGEQRPDQPSDTVIRMLLSPDASPSRSASNSPSPSPHTTRTNLPTPTEPPDSVEASSRE